MQRFPIGSRALAVVCMSLATVTDRHTGARDDRHNGASQRWETGIPAGLRMRGFGHTRARARVTASSKRFPMRTASGREVL